jgi:bacterioferritin-associated ferredoxin
MAIDRCICHKITFREIKKIAHKHNISTLEELQKAKISSTNCKLCEPYVKQMLKDGRTSFSIK